MSIQGTIINEPVYPQIDIDELKEIIKHVCIKLDKPIFVKGRFGNGKSQGANAAVNELNEPGALDELFGHSDHGFKGVIVIDVRLSSFDSVDMRGTPWPDKVSMLTHWLAPGIFPWAGNDAFPDDHLILVLFDEANAASREVFAVLYQFVLDRAVGEHKLKPNVRIALLGNMDDDKGVVNDVPMPLNNRVIHYEMVLNVKKLANHYARLGYPPIIQAFLLACEGLANTYDPETFTPIVATPRTIETAVHLYMSDMPEALKNKSMQGAVGKGWVKQFIGFHDVWQKVPKLSKIIADPLGVELPAELDLVYATVVKVASAMTFKNMEPLYKYLCRFNPMYAVLGVTLALSRDPGLQGTDEYLDYTKRYRDVYSR